LEHRRSTDDTVASFSRVAPVYEVFGRIVQGPPRRRVRELAQLRDGATMLEVATGTGVQLVEWAKLNPSGRTVGAEYAAGMVRCTRKRLERSGLSNVEVHRADARQLPFEDGVFDLVSNEYMLNLFALNEIEPTLAEFRRVLKPGGRLVVTNMTVGATRTHRMWDALYARGIDLFINCRGVLTTPALQNLGFVDISREYMAPMLFPTEIVVADKPR
jgi:ubiquinone/menaquinone biosynthesis C-methylase UbiE